MKAVKEVAIHDSHTMELLRAGDHVKGSWYFDRLGCSGAGCAWGFLEKRDDGEGSTVSWVR